MENKAAGGRTAPTGEIRAERLHSREDEGRVVLTSALSARVLRKDGTVEDLGVICRRKVTDAFVAFMVDELQTETSAWGDFKYHDSGTGTNAENKTDTALQTPCGDARTVGSQTEGATGNIYKSVATHTYDESLAITEHGLFNAAAAGTLMDRHVFAAINVGDGDKIEFTYELTCSSEA